MREVTLNAIADELREIRRLLEAPSPRPDDLVDASYIANRTGLAVRTVLEGKAGTNAIPRIKLKAEGASRPVVRFPRGAADRFVSDLIRAATAPKQRALRLVAKTARRRKLI